MTRNADEQMIRFIDSGYDFLFAVPDGSNIVITHADGETLTRPCQFIDECHTKIGNSIYHICEFAEKLERVGARCAPEEAERQLPDFCYGIAPPSGAVVQIRRGERGYFRSEYSSEYKEYNKVIASQLNAHGGISPRQAAAMLHGSLFGWTTPGADPLSYAPDGSPLQQGAISERSEPDMFRYDRDFIEGIRQDYPAGTKVVLDRMDDPYRDMPPGLKGIVNHVDGIGQIHCTWENGSSLALVPGEDSFHKDLTPDAELSADDAGQDLER